ncbi:MAG: type II toxin-antitoxin system death-on-curing family toxin [Syntrophaceticus sp.]
MLIGVGLGLFVGYVVGIARGIMRVINVTQKEDVFLPNSLLIQETGGRKGVRDDGLLDSALNAPFQTFGGEDMYKSIQAKAAKLAFSLINNHPFIDGNKRIGTLAMLAFLEINGVEIKCTDDD